MPNSRRWSNVSATCRIEWRPSRLLCATLALLGVLGAAAAVLSEAPAWVALPVALASLSAGIAQAFREARRPRRTLTVTAAGIRIDGERMDAARLCWRGPLVSLTSTAGDRKRRLQWWPDTLDAAGRRELKLAVPRPEPGASTSTMAP